MRSLILIILMPFLFPFGARAQNSNTEFVNLRNLDSTFVLDLKYATPDNFLKAAVYDCPECYLRQEAAKALIAAQKEFSSLGFRLKLFDCYRPLDIQKRMWNLVSNPNYVADPSKGSLHNRGLAVDLTLVDENGIELDMGTTFDHFGPESSVTYSGVSKEVRKNRKFLQKIMTRHGFKVLASEWWHFNYQSSQKAEVANYVWPCN